MINMQLIGQMLGRDEGKRLLPYQDSKGIWTVGIGHNLEANGLPHYLFADCPDCAYPECLIWLNSRGGLTEQEMDDLFKDDITHTVQYLNCYNWFSVLDEARTAAVTDMCFNLGTAGYGKFTTFNRLLKEQRYQEAADDLKAQKVYRQLPLRYGRIVEIIATGQIV